MTAFDEASPIAPSESRTKLGNSRHARLAPTALPASLWNWAGPLLVTLFGGFLRFYRLGDPHAVIFDETYYVPDGYSILRHGVELNHVRSVNSLLLRGGTNVFRGGGEYVAHPPLGKVLMAGGDWLIGLTPFGWRFAVAVIGTASILMTARITRRMTTSTLLGCVAGLLMALDGLELVLSRTAILDIFLMFWVLAAFGMLLIDRDVSRMQADVLADGVNLGGGLRRGIRWRRVLAGVFLGCACATKWDGVWFIFAFGALATAWDLSARRATGYRANMRGAPGMRNDMKWLPVSFGSRLIWPHGLAGWSAARVTTGIGRR
jgi:dolichyl-phosphate-mannose-protein mannosyltransferase